MKFHIHALSAREGGRAIVVGAGTGVILAALNAIALKSHVPPLFETARSGFGSAHPSELATQGGVR